jgi:hypothetical protein
VTTIDFKTVVRGSHCVVAQLWKVGGINTFDFLRSGVVYRVRVHQQNSHEARDENKNKKIQFFAPPAQFRALKRYVANTNNSYSMRTI